MSQLAGTWKLMPELSIYEAGDPPSSGEYRIAFRQDAVEIRIEWQAADGERHAIEFGGRCDGCARPTGQPGLTAASFTLVDDATLDSAAFDEAGVEVMYARRRVSRDGQLLTTIQRTRRPDGKTFSNFQVYRRG